MTTTTDQITYRVPGISCGHCGAAITAEIEKLAGIESVSVDLGAKRVTVTGSGLDDGALRAAIDEAGYDAE
jgi:copper chaperone